MLTKLSVAETEHIDGVEFQLIACRPIPEKPFSDMGTRYRIIDKDKIAFGNHTVDGCAEIRYGRKKSSVEFYKSGFALLRIRIVLDIILTHNLTDSIQVAFAEHFFIEFPYHFFIFFYAHMDSLSVLDEA